MEEQLVAARAHLRRLLHDHPEWPYQEYADQIGRPRDSRQALGQAVTGGACHR